MNSGIADRFCSEPLQAFATASAKGMVTPLRTRRARVEWLDCQKTKWLASSGRTDAATSGMREKIGASAIAASAAAEAANMMVCKESLALLANVMMQEMAPLT